MFATRTARPLGDDNVRNRVFKPAVERANRLRTERQLPSLPAITPHSLRRTYISALFALGWEVPVVMAEVGHSDPKVTLGIYAVFAPQVAQEFRHCGQRRPGAQPTTPPEPAKPRTTRTRYRVACPTPQGLSGRPTLNSLVRRGYLTIRNLLRLSADLLPDLSVARPLRR